MFGPPGDDTDWITDTNNFVTGMGDNLSFGLTADARRMMGTDDTVDYNSGTYQIREGAGTLVGIGLPVPKLKALGVFDNLGASFIGVAGWIQDINKTHLHHIVPKGFAKHLPFTMSLFDEVVQVPPDIHRGWHSGKGLPYPGGIITIGGGTGGAH